MNKGAPTGGLSPPFHECIFLFLINEMLKNNITSVYLFKFTQVAAEGRVRGGLAGGWVALYAYFITGNRNAS